MDDLLLLCAWIMWQQFSVGGKKLDSDMSEAFSKEDECKDTLTRFLERQRKAGREVVGSYIKAKAEGKVDSYFICLPDSVKLQ